MTLATRSLPVTQPADHVPGPPQGQWTYADYTAISDDGQRYEVIRGVLYVTAAPNTLHQQCIGNSFFELTSHLRSRKLGQVFVAPTDVELLPGEVVQPDVFVILREHADRITFSRIVGAPDLVVEVGSPSTTTYDRQPKMDAYRRAGVPEYWLPDPYSQTVEVWTLAGEQYRLVGVFTGDVSIPSMVLPGLSLRAEQLFGA